MLSDGEEGMRTIVGTWFGAKSTHVLDWFHIARRLERIDGVDHDGLPQPQVLLGQGLCNDIGGDPRLIPG